MIQEYIIETCLPGGEWHHADPMETFSSRENARLTADWMCMNADCMGGVLFGVRISKLAIQPVEVIRKVPRE